MKTFHKHSVVTALVFSLLLGFSGPSSTYAATFVDLGAAEDFSVLAGASIVDSNISVIGGDVGLSPGTDFGALTSAEVAGTIYAVDASGPDGVAGDNPTLVNSAKLALTAAYIDAFNQPTTGVISADLGGQILTAGVYEDNDAPDSLGITGTLTLDAEGNPDAVFIFKTGGSLTTAGSSEVELVNGAQACNVFWQVGSSATLGTGSDFSGTILADQSITDDGGSTIEGRLLASIATVTLDDTTIIVPTCVSAAAFVVNKVIVNDDGGSMTIADFPLFVGATAVTHGVSSNFAAGVYTVSETTNGGYTQSFSGNCDANGVVTLTSGANAACTITNDDIEQSSGGGGGGFINPPLIDVVKVPSPLALPNGPGGVTYSYTVRNIGPVAMTNVTTVDDSCGPLTLVSGDSNANATLEVSETWSYTCSTTLSSTHTNTVTATGWANGINAIDVAVATVVVGEPIVPPLIHVTKVPNPLFLPVAGGLVTYTERITNPGTVPLANVTLVDDKCSPLSFISGDVDGDALLDTTETWTYTCARNLTQTTTNTATATGEANGITVTDFAIATVIVGVPGFPSTGIGPGGNGTLWVTVIIGMFLVVSVSLVVTLRKRTN